MLVYETTGIKPKELEILQEQECPYEFFHIWLAFQALSTTRSNNGFGPDPITYSEIAAYMQCMEDELSSEDIEILKQVDLIYLSKISKKLSKK